MVVSSTEQQDMVYGIRKCSVGPGKISGQNMVHEPSNMDLAMKLHYLRAVYLFSSEAIQDLTVQKIKESCFTFFVYYFIPCGRLRRSDSGRPYIKCNDCGVRFVEAHCSKTIEEWLELKDASDDNIDSLLVPHNVLGPELPHSPPVFIQVTTFKCGGISLGLGWSHILGDAFSASDFMNSWGQVLAGLVPKIQVTIPNKIGNPDNSSISFRETNSEKRDADHWIINNNTRMVTFSLNVTSSHLTSLKFKILGHDQTHDVESIPSFESLCALIWKCIAKVKEGEEPKKVTICKKNQKRKVGELSNYGQMIFAVKACFTIQDASIEELATLLTDNVVDERRKIEDAMEKKENQGGNDFVVYGENLTFVDLEEADLYGFLVNEHKALYVNYYFEGVGDEGMVLVLPEPSDSGKNRDGGRVVTITLPEYLALKVKSELGKELSII